MANRSASSDQDHPSKHPVSQPEHAEWLNRFVWTVLWKIVAVGLLVFAGLWAAYQARHLLGLLIVATFFALAMLPGVNTLHGKFRMRRGLAVAIIYAAGVVFVAFMIAVLIPGIVTFSSTVRDNWSDWFNSFDTWASSHIGWHPAEYFNTDGTPSVVKAMQSWGNNVLGAVTTGIGLVFDLVTVAAFSFYIAADFPRIMKALLSRMPAERQKTFDWVVETSIQQTGGYLYSRMLLMLISGGTGFAVMMITGLPVLYALPLALFMGFVSEFIPFIGTYLGAAIPVLVLLAVQGPAAAIALVVWVVIYQQIENYFLSPRISSKTMELNGAIAFGSAIAGASIAGPMGAFMALPVAALVSAIIKNTGKRYEVTETINESRK